MNPDFFGSTDPRIERIREAGLPLYCVSNGLQPFTHDLRTDEALSDDGWLYRRGKRIVRWYVGISDQPHLGPLSGGLRLILRRDHLNIAYVEDLRWRFGRHCHTFVRGKRERAVAALRDVEDPHFYRGDVRVDLTFSDSHWDNAEGWTHVSEREAPKAGDLITRIGQIGAAPGLEAGAAYHSAQEWCSARHVMSHTLKRLLGVLFDDLLIRAFGDSLSQGQNRMRKVYALVNGRSYLIHNKGTEPQSHWPEPADTIIDVSTVALPDRFFGRGGVVMPQPYKRK